jgi:predicted RND superfamily exporter protein
MPPELKSVIANKKLEETFDMATTHLLLVDSDVSQKDVRDMTGEMRQVDGVKSVIGIDSLLGAGIPESIIPKDVLSLVKGERYQLMLINSAYVISSDEVNAQIDSLNTILKKYDKGGMLIGEAPCTKDLIACTDRDFTVVSLISIIAIFVIILLVQKSISLPVILVAVIEFGIMLNMGIPYYTGTKLPFIANIVIGTIQLGATVDYAILMTTRFRRNRSAGSDKKASITDAVESSAKSIVVSALSFFAATFGVGLYSNIDMISSLCVLMSRGALISMICVIFLLPSLLLIFDSVISKTTMPQKG